MWKLAQEHISPLTDLCYDMRRDHSKTGGPMAKKRKTPSSIGSWIPRINMKKIKTAISILWFLFVSLSSPLWIGCIYMNITGHGKGYAYDMHSEADIAIFFGIILLLLWLLALLPVTISLCKKSRRKEKSFLGLPLLAFAGLFVAGIYILGCTTLQLFEK